MSLKGILKRTKTYEVGIAQMLAIKTTNNGRAIILDQYDLTTIEWFVLGMAYNETPAGGIRVTDLATMLEVKTTYITSILRTLKDKGYAQTMTDPNDARVRLVVATEKANHVINAIEDSLQDKIEPA
jgi:DNA-binding MarR family transcriptional regulator